MAQYKYNESDYAVADPLLGTMSDKDVTATKGVPMGASAIYKRRLALGISAFKRPYSRRMLASDISKLLKEWRP